MAFFSNEIAATLQYFTFPLELIGITLAAIEVRFPLMASRINRYLLEEAGYQDLLSQKTLTDLMLHPEIPPVGPLSKLTQLQMKTLVISTVSIVLMIFGFALISMYQQEHYLPLLITLAALILLVPFTYAGIRISNTAYRFINSWVPGRTVGTLGIIIAGFGVLGEAYQFTTQFVV
jgi:hypothetical protein